MSFPFEAISTLMNMIQGNKPFDVAKALQALSEIAAFVAQFFNKVESDTVGYSLSDGTVAALSVNPSDNDELLDALYALNEIGTVSAPSNDSMTAKSTTLTMAKVVMAKNVLRLGTAWVNEKLAA